MPRGINKATGKSNSIYTDELANQICAYVADAMSLRKISAMDGMPHYTTIFDWARDRPDFQAKYTKALSLRSDRLFEDMLDIADDVEKDLKSGKDGQVIVDYENIQRAKLRIDTRKWVLGVMAPHKYGPRLVHSGDETAPIEVRVLTNRERAKALAALLAKQAK